MIKKVAIISINIKTSESIMNEMLEILTYDVILKPYSLSEEIHDLESYNLIVFSSSFSYDFIFQHYNPSVMCITLNRIINLNNIKEILELPHHEKVFVASSHAFNCLEIIDQLKHYGMDHITYYPYYDFIETYENLSIAITADEEEVLPSCVTQSINIGCRCIDITSMVEILLYLDLIDKYKHALNSYFYKKAFVSPAKKLITHFTTINKDKKFLSDILDNLQLGIISFNSSNNIQYCNRYSRDALNIDKQLESSHHIKFDKSILKNPDFITYSNYMQNSTGEETQLLTFESSDTIKGKDESVRIKKRDLTNIAKYSFNDIKSISPKQNQIIQMAKKMAKTSSTIIIQGESGTGKELMAQSIHNYSNRSQFPFVAINFSAIPESLLESELFGYEGGSFTGAKRDGKEGLLRKAQNGTLFLDEIGDIPFNLQVKLLRVIQEREIIPIGGTTPIPIDVRIISATNKNLAEEVRNNRFREDLFYRLNVLPIYTIPLRHRTEDILYMINFFIQSFSDFKNWQELFTTEVANFLISYKWPGNLRELENIVEYFLSIYSDGEIIDISQIPIYMYNTSSISNTFSGDFRLWILQKLKDYPGIGRSGLADLAKYEIPQLTESKIRSLMMDLKENGLINMRKGIKGTELAPSGIELLKSLQ